MALIRFDNAEAASRRIAGVAAAARIVRELSLAGVREAWLAPSDGGALCPLAVEDIERLREGMTVHVGDPGWPMAELPGDRLIPAAYIPAALDGRSPPPSVTIRFDERAAARILAATVKAGDGLVSRMINRPISRRISAALLTIPGARPIHATMGTAVLALMMVIALFKGGANGLVVGAILFQAASLFDGVDGEMARSTFRSTKLGAALDTGIDMATNLLFILGVTLALAPLPGTTAEVLGSWGLTLLTIGLLAIGVRTTREDNGPFRLDLVKHGYAGRFSGRYLPALMSFLTIVSSRDFFALFFATLILLGMPMAVLYIFALATTVWIMFVAALLLSQPTASSQRMA